jgi:hypothetical protein
LITNKGVKPSGIYRFYKDEHLTKIGLNQKTFDNAMNTLRARKKIILFKNWIFVVKFLKETFNLPQKILSKHIKKSIENQFSVENIPLELIAYFYSVYDTLFITYPYPIDTILDFRLEILDFRLEIRDKNTCGVSDEKFEEFWKAYPSRNGKKLYKANAKEQLNKIKENDLDSVMLAVRNYAKSKNVKEGVGIKDAFRWLRDGCWKEWLEEETSITNSPEKPPKENPYFQAMQEGEK